MTPEDVVRAWLGQSMWGMYASTPGRKHFKWGDRLCVYAVKQGVCAYATIAGPADTILADADLPTPKPKPDPLYRVPLQDVQRLATPVPL